MNKISYGIIAGALAVSILSLWYFCLNPQVLKQDFERGLGEWVADVDVPLDPNNPSHFVEWNITCASDVARSGRYSLRLFIDGRQDDGTIWIERKMNVGKNAQTDLKVSFEFYSERESFNDVAAACVYAGIFNPEAEQDFAVLGSANQLAGWKKYTYTATLNTGSSEEVWIAVGISVRWETYMTYYIDDVEIEIK